MGGRGSRSSGRHRAPNGYSTVGKIRGVRVIQDKKTGKGLPFHGPKNGSFYRKSRSGAVEQFRKYDRRGFPKKDIDTGHDHGQGDPHVHDWVNGKRQIGRPPTIGELKKIKFKTKEQK